MCLRWTVVPEGSRVAFRCVDHLGSRLPLYMAEADSLKMLLFIIKKS